MKRRLDANDATITRALREQGALVWHLDTREPGRPDKLVAFLGQLTLLEIKTPKTGRLSREQREAHAEMARHGVRVHVVRTVREALDAVGIGQRVDAERRRALGEIAAGLRQKSDAFERRAKLVPGRHDYRGNSAWEDAHRESPIPEKVLP
jgi:hypothetical protein